MREKQLNWLRRFIDVPSLWKFNNDSIAKGVGIGLFIAFLPLPLQMVWASILAILLRANLPIAIVLTWINNPLTFIPINIFIYKIGVWVLGDNSHRPLPPEWDWHATNFQEYLGDFIAWIPSLGITYFMGLLIIAGGSASIGYAFIRIIGILINKKH